MNRKQKIVTIVGTIIIVLMCLVPPWTRISDYEGHPKRFAGYSLLFERPKYKKPPVKKSLPSIERAARSAGDRAEYKIDFARLELQVFIIIVATVGLNLCLRNSKKKKES